jgi:hypothetical protein
VGVVEKEYQSKGPRVRREGLPFCGLGSGDVVEEEVWRLSGLR